MNMDIVMPCRDKDFDVLSGFRNPPPGYGEVPFYWWMGDKLDRERLLWQLDQLSGYAISGLQVNYAHSDVGGLSWGLTMQSDPQLFSDEWWELFNWFREEANNRGYSVSLSDYTLGSPGQGWYVDEVLREDPGICGASLEHSAVDVVSGCYEAETTEGLLSVTAYLLADGAPDTASPVDLLRLAADGKIRWATPEGKPCRVVSVFARKVPQSIDPMNPNSGKKVIEKFFQRFEDKGNGSGSRGLNFFFSDELNFGISGNLWNSSFAEEFHRRKGYDLPPLLPALFMDIGDVTPKVRLDYRDVMVELEEDGYFRPVYQWHQDRGMVYGCDHGGRGTDVIEFGDYFRTQRWNQGPGNDQSNLASELIKNKVSSSIAHLYERPRTWLEGFHSSGWGTTSADVARAIFRNFAMGQNLLSLHGLYYSTHGGWWEWAPPCNHFHMPYFKHMKPLLKCAERLSYVLSQGVHRCDVAVVYPVAAMEAGMAGEAAVATAFSVGEHLYHNGIDFDFMDFQSLERATIENGSLNISGESFKVLILPNMQAVRYTTLGKAAAFCEAGGVVIAVGALPVASDRAGREDAVLDALVNSLFGDSRSFIARDAAEATGIVEAVAGRDFTLQGVPCNGEVGFQHRIIGNRHLYMLHGVPAGTSCLFRAKGEVSFWNPWTGEATACTDASSRDDGVLVRMPGGPGEVQLVVIDPDQPLLQPVVQNNRTVSLPLGNSWEFELEPVLDNRWGDYRLPATPGKLGVEVHHLQHAVSASGKMPGVDGNWEAVTVSYGPRFWKLGPVPANHALMLEPGLIALDAVCPERVVIASGQPYGWQPYDYSERWGVPGDPGHQGYHGLKGVVHNEFIALGKMERTWTSTKYVSELDGGIYYLWSTIYAPISQKAAILAGEPRPAALWLNGKALPFDAETAELQPGENILLLRYDGPCKTYFILSKPGFMEGWKQEYPLAMDWYRNPGVYPFNCKAQDENETSYYRFTCPPGLRSMEFSAYGSVKALLDGVEMDTCLLNRELDGLGRYSATAREHAARCVPVVIEITGTRETTGGAALPEPIQLYCGGGKTGSGDWSQIDGLRSYSGGAWYRKTVRLTELQSSKCVLKLGCLSSSAEVHVNGKLAGIVCAPPWEVDITSAASEGDNRLEILVCNTLANYYTTVPTWYRGSLLSGLIGPVAIEITR